MTALIVLSQKQAKLMVAQAIAQKLKDTTKRVYIAYGSTNQMILYALGIDKQDYYNGYIQYSLGANKHKPDVVILNDKNNEFAESIGADDIIIKGANALSYESGKYKAAVAVASPQGGTYANVVIKASFVGAQVIIPVTHEKLVPTLLSGKYHQNSFDFAEDFPVALIEHTYGEVYTEINALKDSFDLESQIYLAGSIDTTNRTIAFVIQGKKKDIHKLLKWKEKNK